MGGLPLILAGDFRQTLPVIPKADEITACLKYSRTIWPKVRTMRLTTNMRVHLYGDSDSGSYAFERFEYEYRAHTYRANLHCKYSLLLCT